MSSPGSVFGSATTRASPRDLGPTMGSEVSCEFCENKLGVTYVVAPDARNQYKAAVLELHHSLEL